MHDLIRKIIESNGWAAREGVLDHVPPDLADDYSARIIALLVERLGGSVELDASDIARVPEEVVLLPYSLEPEGDSPPDLRLETRRLAK